jgi:hypothetical protein
MFSLYLYRDFLRINLKKFGLKCVLKVSPQSRPAAKSEAAFPCILEIGKSYLFIIDSILNSPNGTKKSRKKLCWKIFIFSLYIYKDFLRINVKKFGPKCVFEVFPQERPTERSSGVVLGIYKSGMLDIYNIDLVFNNPNDAFWCISHVGSRSEPTWLILDV